VGFETKYYLWMDLGKHFTNQNNGECELLDKGNLALDICALVLSRR
jgi:hypothetical protein